MKELELQACVYSRTAPEEAQLAQLRAFLDQKYRRPVRLRWERDERMKDAALALRVALHTDGRQFKAFLEA